MSRAHSYSHSIAHSRSFPSLRLRHSSFSIPSVAFPRSQLILQSFRCFTYVTDHSPTFLSLILKPFLHFTYVTAHSPTLPSLYLRHSSSQTIPSLHLRHSSFSTFPSLYLRHSSFSNPSVASPMSQLILQPLRHFTYVTAHSPTLPLLHQRHISFSNSSFASLTSQVCTYITWRTAHAVFPPFFFPQVYLPKSF